MTLVWLALWPGLDALYRRLWRHFAGAPDDLVSEISERFTAALHRFDRARVRRVAATLLMNVERDIRTGLKARWAEAARRCDPPEGIAAGEAVPLETPAPSVFGLPAGIDAGTAAALCRAILTGLIGGDADLVVAVVIVGEEQGEAAGRLGIRPDAARKRFQRALHRLRHVLASA